MNHHLCGNLKSHILFRFTVNNILRLKNASMRLIHYFAPYNIIIRISCMRINPNTVDPCLRRALTEPYLKGRDGHIGFCFCEQFPQEFQRQVVRCLHRHRERPPGGPPLITLHSAVAYPDKHHRKPSLYERQFNAGAQPEGFSCHVGSHVPKQNIERRFVLF
jgi:hypothetical protein